MWHQYMQKWIILARYMTWIAQNWHIPVIARYLSKRKRRAVNTQKQEDRFSYKMYTQHSPVYIVLKSASDI